MNQLCCTIISWIIQSLTLNNIFFLIFNFKRIIFFDSGEINKQINCLWNILKGSFKKVCFSSDFLWIKLLISNVIFFVSYITPLKYYFFLRKRTLLLALVIKPVVILLVSSSHLLWLSFLLPGEYHPLQYSFNLRHLTLTTAENRFLCSPKNISLSTTKVPFSFSRGFQKQSTLIITRLPLITNDKIVRTATTLRYITRKRVDRHRYASRDDNGKQWHPRN